jgi:HEAT repeat protein
VRVAAAIALRRAGDGRGADVLLGVLADPVEGPEARAALLVIAGRDVGEDPAAWEEFLRVRPGGAK